jgi:hypothetical protein
VQILDKLGSRLFATGICAVYATSGPLERELGARFARLRQQQSVNGKLPALVVNR